MPFIISPYPNILPPQISSSTLLAPTSLYFLLSIPSKKLTLMASESEDESKAAKAEGEGEGEAEGEGEGKAEGEAEAEAEGKAEAEGEGKAEAEAEAEAEVVTRSSSSAAAAALPEEEHPVKAFGWAASDKSGHLSPFNFSRRSTGEEDVRFQVLYCGICHTDLHNIKNEWGSSNYPILPGHEIVGTVTEVGSKVKKFKVGDRVGVGCLVGACHSCNDCCNGQENYCPKLILTYGSLYHDGTVTYGGYSDTMVATERYVIRIPEKMPLDKGAPLLCAGVTVYSPLKYYGLCEPGMHIGVAGLGGLGHIAVKFAKAFGCKVTVISTSPSKKQEAIENLGADMFLLSQDEQEMQSVMGTMDGVIDTVSAVHPLLPLISLLKSHGKLVMVGGPDRPLQLPVFPLLAGRKIVGGSSIGGLKETQEMIDFAAEHDVKPDIEVVPMDYVNTAMHRLARGDVRYRFVIDIGNTLPPTKP